MIFFFLYSTEFRQLSSAASELQANDLDDARGSVQIEI